MKNILSTIMGIVPSTVIVTDFEAVAAGETVIGVIPDDIRKWHGYRGRLVDEYNAAAPALVAERQGYVKQLEELHGGEKDCEGACEPVLAQIKEVERKLSALRDPIDKIGEMFWDLIRMEFGLQGGNLALREGWQLVSIPKEPREEVFEVLFGDEGGSGLLSGLMGSVLLGGLLRRRPGKRKPAEAPAGAPSAS